MQAHQDRISSRSQFELGSACPGSHGNQDMQSGLDMASWSSTSGQDQQPITVRVGVCMPWFPREPRHAERFGLGVVDSNCDLLLIRS